MSKKKINKIKTKQKQRQKQTQNVIVNIHKSTRTRKPTNNETPRRNVQQLPTPQYIYTSQTDNLVPQMFNKQGQQETLAEQINKTLDEKINKLVLEHTTKPTQPTQPTQQEVSNKPQPTQQKVPDIFTNKQPPQLSNIQQDKPSENESILVKSENETIHSIINKKPLLPTDELEKIKKLQEDMIKKKRSSGNVSEGGYVTEGGEQAKEKRKTFFGNKPEEKIPSLIESIKNKQEAAKKEYIIQQQEIEQMRKNDNESLRHLTNKRLFDLIEQQNIINRKLTKIEKEKKNAVHGTKGTFDDKIKEHKSKLKSTTLNIEILKNKIKSIK